MACTLVVALTCVLAVLPAFANVVPVQNDVHHMTNKNERLFALSAFSWSDCGEKNLPGHIEKFALTPDPLKLPGNVNVAFDALLNVTITAPLSLELYIKKHTFLGWIPLPCIDNVGSCTYQDVCPLITHLHCPQIFKDHGIPCQCPIAAGKYSLPSTPFYVDDSRIPSFLTNGDYQVTARLSHGQNIACAYFEFGITSSS